MNKQLKTRKVPVKPQFSVSEIADELGRRIQERDIIIHNLECAAQDRLVRAYKAEQALANLKKATQWRLPALFVIAGVWIGLFISWMV